MSNLPKISINSTAFRIGLCAMIGLLAPGVASARSQGSSLGNPAYGSDAACFNTRDGGVQRACSSVTGYMNWTMPLVLDNNGGLNVTVGVRGNGVAQDVVCQSFSVPQYADSVRFGGQAWTVYADRRVEQLVLPISPHGFGTTIALCAMKNATSLYTVNY